MIYDNLTFQNPKLRSETQYIVICDTQSDTLDALKLHYHYIYNKQLSGIPYHYTIFKNGDIHNCRPINYISELYPSLQNDIIIAIEGDTNAADITNEQKSSLVFLCKMLLDKECLPLQSVITLSDIAGGYNPGDKVDWNDIKGQVNNYWTNKKSIFNSLSNIKFNENNRLPIDYIDYRLINKYSNLSRMINSAGISSNNAIYPTGSTPGNPMLFKNNAINQAFILSENCTKQALLLSEIISNKTESVSNMYMFDAASL